MKRSERVEALVLRRNGVSYQEILNQHRIAKSTLWRWLKAEGLVDGQSQRYREHRLLAQRKAAETVHRARIDRTRAITSRAAQEIGRLTTRELCLIGAALYWAEGAKQKESKQQVSEQVIFANTDANMHQIFIKFLQVCCGVQPTDLRFRIYLHETASAEEARTYWFQQLGLRVLQAAPISWKRHQPSSGRISNVGKAYHGLLRVVVPKSTNLNRRIQGWIDGMHVAIGE